MSKRLEEISGEKWDRCLTDTVLKTASGLTLGLAISVLFFKRRPWAVFLGTGIGLGMGCSNCQNAFRSVTPIRADRHVPLKSTETD